MADPVPHAIPWPTIPAMLPSSPGACPCALVGGGADCVRWTPEDEYGDGAALAVEYDLEEEREAVGTRR
eukprot:CAMPEP_0183825854 /NCGR_PEP_ID=MMETSP0807_2-20130328/1378_1 /TAXON_ID=88271 /ORGANISM="Picocystis salinarum, Strain CCMP1897" /LENGTH=68 /DNA_ID=CAMNT_0026070913 /DNA_START=130 /DNA_END=336 /DNA_ORIENTATION=+